MSEYGGELPGPRSEAPTTRRFPIILLAFLLSAAVTLYAYVPLYGLRLRPRVLEDLRYLLFDLQSGFLGLLIGLFVLFAAPFLLARISRPAADRRRGSTAADPADPAGPGRSSGPIFSSDASDDEIAVPSMALREMGSGERWEMAEALGIPWRDELILDHESWETACRAAIDREAERLRR